MEHFHSFCRLCLSKNGSLLYIFDNDKIQQQLNDCFSIKVSIDDKFPKHVCSDCATTLQKYHTFYMEVKQCERLLNAILGSGSSNSSPSKNNVKSIELKTSKNTQLIQPASSSLLSEISNNSDTFDNMLLSNNPEEFSVMEYLDESISEADITQALLQNGAKFTKIANVVQKDTSDSYEIHMEIDVLDQDFEIVNEILARESQNNVASNESYSCMSCKAIFSDFDFLTKHMEICSVLKNACSECDMVFSTKIQLQKHMQIHKKTDPFQCKYCNSVFDKKIDLQEHTQSVHLDFPIGTNCIFRCKKCNAIFKSRKDLYLHVKSHLKPKMKHKKDKFTCIECNKGFLNLENLQNHKKIWHEDNSDSLSACVYRCKICSVLFTNRNKLYNHIKQHTDALGEDNPKLCDTCGKSFTTAKALSRHVQIHKGKSLTCNVCSKQFSSSDILEEHVNSHNTGTQICELCGQIFTDEYNLHNHKMKNHCMDVLK